MLALKLYQKVWYKSEKAFGLWSEWHYTTRGWCMDTYNHSPWRARDYMYPSTNLPRCVMPFRSEAHAFSPYDRIIVPYLEQTSIYIHRIDDVFIFVNLMPIIIYAPSEHVLSTGILMFITGIATLRLWTSSIFSRCPRVSALLWNS